MQRQQKQQQQQHISSVSVSSQFHCSPYEIQQRALCLMSHVTSHLELKKVCSRWIFSRRKYCVWNVLRSAGPNPKICFQISGSVYSRSVSVLWLAVQGRGPAHSLTVDYLEVLHLRSLHRDKLELNLRNKQFRQNPVILIPHQSPGPTDRQSTSHQLSLSLTPQSTTVLFHSLVFIIIVSLSLSLSLYFTKSVTDSEHSGSYR